MNKGKGKDKDSNLHKRAVGEAEQKTPVVSSTVNESNDQEPQGKSFCTIVMYIIGAFFVLQMIGAFYQFYGIMYPTPDAPEEDSPYKYVNLLKNNQPFNLTIYLMDENIKFVGKIWEEPFLTYNYSDKYPLVKEIELPVSSAMKQNKTMYIYAELSAPNFYHGIHRDRPSQGKRAGKNSLSEKVDSRILKFQSTFMPLIRYEKKFQIEEVNLIDSEMGTGSSATISDDKTLYPYVKANMYVTLVHDAHAYYENEFSAKGIRYEKEGSELYYNPRFYVSDFWTLKRHLVLINESVNTVNLTLNFYTISPGKQIYMDSMKLYEMIPGVLDETKEMLTDANVYLLGVTMVAVLVHYVLYIMSVKNDIQFWRNSKSFKGISIKSLFVSVLFDIIIFLYVLDSSSETSTLIIAEIGFSMLASIWKITRVCTFSLKPQFPFVSLKYQHEYEMSKTDDYDTTAIKFMSMLLLPCFLAYCVYSFIYKSHKGYYSFLVGTLAGGIYVFGFILMTPQLYINYKLKSVAHLPWRPLFYKFLSTIIDDLASFLVKMPMLRRLACFRDDVIFVIYIYQRYIYRIDKTRVDPVDGEQQ